MSAIEACEEMKRLNKITKTCTVLVDKHGFILGIADVEPLTNIQTMLQKGQTRIPATLTYELPRKPMKVEFETRVNEAYRDFDKDSFIITASIKDDRLKQFIGKRTKITIEEVE